MNVNMKMLKITPTDTLFLGGGKTFAKGESTWHQSRLIPHPSVFFGAICSAMLEKNHERRKAYIGGKDADSDPRNYLELGGIYLYEQKSNALGDNLYLPAPKDLFIDSDKKVYYGDFCKIDDKLDSNLQEVSYYLENPKAEDVDRADGMFVDWYSFMNAYFRNETSIKVITADAVAAYTYKVGIQKAGVQRDNAKIAQTTSKQPLYRLDLLDFNENGWSYIVEYKIDDTWWIGESVDGQMSGKGFLKLGGENKACRYENIENRYWVETFDRQMQIKNDWKYVKLFIKTPALFGESSWKPQFTEQSIEVIAGVTAKPYAIGGFDMVLNKPKPMSQAVPEGSVYLLKSNLFVNKSFIEIKEILTKKVVCKDTKIGFGQFEVVPFYEEQMGDEKK